MNKTSSSTNLSAISRDWSAEARKAKFQKRRRRILFGIANHSVLVAMSAVFLMPLFLIVVISLMDFQQASPD